MKLIENIKRDWNEDIVPSFKTKNSRIGSYTLAVCALFLAILIVVNLFAGLLPSTWTSFDVSSAKLYSVGSNTKVVLNNLNKDVTIYWIVQAGEEDTTVQKLLENYDDLSDHVTLVVKDPDKYPTFASQYTSSTVDNNSLIVECGEVYTFIAYDDLYEYESYYYSSYASGFAGESEITSAIRYVSSDVSYKMYIMTGHGESDVSDAVISALNKQLVDTEELSLLTIDEIPEDADMILINSPQSDISSIEADMLRDYVQNGGHLFVLSGALDEITLDNLNGLLADYNVTVESGLLMDTNRNYYAYGYPYMLLPEIYDHDITDGLISEGYYVLLPICNALTKGTYTGSASVRSLLVTSDDGLVKTDGYNFTSYSAEEDDISGCFNVGLLIEESEGGNIFWVSSGYLINDTYDSYSSGANMNLFLSAVSYMDGDDTTGSISVKSLGYTYLTISESEASMIKTIIVGVIPVAFLLIGIIIVIKRRNMA